MEKGSETESTRAAIITDKFAREVSKIGTLFGPVISHFAASLCLTNTAQLFVAVLASSASTPPAHASARE